MVWGTCWTGTDVKNCRGCTPVLKKNAAIRPFLQIINEEIATIVLILPGGLTRYTGLFCILESEKAAGTVWVPLQFSLAQM